MNQQQHQLMKILQKIPVFAGFSLEQAELMIRISKFQKFAAGTQIYIAGDESKDFLVLILGSLQILSPAGQELVVLNPSVSIGEMGVFTGHRRSATVVAQGDVAGLVFGRADLFQLMEGDVNIKATILGNVLEELASRLEEANQKSDVLIKTVEQKDNELKALRGG